jgi:hypothetical protein
MPGARQIVLIRTGPQPRPTIWPYSVDHSRLSRKSSSDDVQTLLSPLRFLSTFTASHIGIPDSEMVDLRACFPIHRDFQRLRAQIAPFARGPAARGELQNATGQFSGPSVWGILAAVSANRHGKGINNIFRTMRRFPAKRLRRRHCDHIPIVHVSTASLRQVRNVCGTSVWLPTSCGREDSESGRLFFSSPECSSRSFVLVLHPGNRLPLFEHCF